MSARGLHACTFGTNSQNSLNRSDTSGLVQFSAGPGGARALARRRNDGDSVSWWMSGKPESLFFFVLYRGTQHGTVQLVKVAGDLQVVSDTLPKLSLTFGRLGLERFRGRRLASTFLSYSERGQRRLSSGVRVEGGSSGRVVKFTSRAPASWTGLVSEALSQDSSRRRCNRRGYPGGTSGRAQFKRHVLAEMFQRCVDASAR